MKAILNDFAFRGLLGRHCVVESQQRGLLRIPAASEQERVDHDLMAPVPEAIRIGSIAMQRKCRLLFVFENIIREFISARFAEIDGDGWFELRASTAMKQKVQDRKEKEEKNQWHVGRNSHPIFYLDFGDLGSLITTHCTGARRQRLRRIDRPYNLRVAVDYTKAEVADIIEAFLDGTGGKWDWDDFTSLRISDPELEAIRIRCGELYDWPTYGMYCGPEGFAEMRRMVERLRADITRQPLDR